MAAPRAAGANNQFFCDYVDLIDAGAPSCVTEGALGEVQAQLNLGTLLITIGVELTNPLELSEGALLLA